MYGGVGFSCRVQILCRILETALASALEPTLQSHLCFRYRIQTRIQDDCSIEMRRVAASEYPFYCADTSQSRKKPRATSGTNGFDSDLQVRYCVEEERLVSQFCKFRLKLNSSPYKNASIARSISHSCTNRAPSLRQLVAIATWLTAWTLLNRSPQVFLPTCRISLQRALSQLLLHTLPKYLALGSVGCNVGCNSKAFLGSCHSFTIYVLVTACSPPVQMLVSPRHKSAGAAQPKLFVPELDRSCVVRECFYKF